MAHNDIGTVTGDVDNPLQTWASGARDNQEDHDTRLTDLEVIAASFQLLGRSSGSHSSTSTFNVEILDYSWPLGTKYLIMYCGGAGGGNKGQNASSFAYNVIDVEEELITGGWAYGYDDDNPSGCDSYNGDDCADGFELNRIGSHNGTTTEPRMNMTTWKPDDELRLEIGLVLSHSSTWSASGYVYVEAWGMRGYDLLENFKDDTKFSSDGNTTLISNTSEYTQGANSLKVAKTGTADTDNWAYFMPTTPWDWSSYDSFEIDAYITSADLLKLESFKTRLVGGGGASTILYKWPAADISEGWNTLTLNQASVDSVTGTPNFSEVVYTDYYADSNDSTDTLASPSFDNFRGIHDTLEQRLHSFEDETLFTPSTDASTELDIVNFIQGYSATKVVKTGTTEAYASAELAISPLGDWSMYIRIGIDLYIPVADLAAISSAQLKFGQLWTDYYTYTEASLSSGWNYLIFNVDSPNSTVGTPDLYAVDGISFVANTSLASDTLTGITWDNLKGYLT